MQINKSWKEFLKENLINLPYLMSFANTFTAINTPTIKMSVEREWNHFLQSIFQIKLVALIYNLLLNLAAYFWKMKF